ncbi:MAG: hypothetical protein HY717_05305 [Planctomycetes bacterium]|nr:hypothetical protein [Planctomycetota bacterium]
MAKKPENESKRLKKNQPSEDPGIVDPTIIMRTEGIEDTKLMSKDMAAPQAAEAPIQPAADFNAGTEMVTQSIDEHISPVLKDGPPTETEEVLVLLPDEGEGGKEGSGKGEAIPFVETQEVEEADINTDTAASGKPVGSTTAESIENIGLKSVNPLAGTEEIAGAEGTSEAGGSTGRPEAEASGSDTENIGVMDEIAELATSLDEDILNAGTASDSASKEGVKDQVGDAAGPLLEGSEDIAAAESAPQKSKTRVLLVASGLAASIGLGLFFFPEISEWFNANFGEGGTASATTGIKRGHKPHPAPVIGTKPGGTEVAAVPGTPPAEAGGAGGPAAPAGSGNEANPSSVRPAGGEVAQAELSATRIAVRKKVLLALRLGLPGKMEKESE